MIKMLNICRKSSQIFHKGLTSSEKCQIRHIRAEQDLNPITQGRQIPKEVTLSLWQTNFQTAYL